LYGILPLTPWKDLTLNQEEPENQKIKIKIVKKSEKNIEMVHCLHDVE